MIDLIESNCIESIFNESHTKCKQDISIVFNVLAPIRIGMAFVRLCLMIGSLLLFVRIVYVRVISKTKTKFTHVTVIKEKRLNSRDKTLRKRYYTICGYKLNFRLMHFIHWR